MINYKSGKSRVGMDALTMVEKWLKWRRRKLKVMKEVKIEEKEYLNE